MAISMSGATVDMTERDALLASSVEASGSYGGEIANTNWLGQTSGESLAGITASFAANVSTAIDSYSEEVMNRLNNVQTAVDSGVAFKGSGITAALDNFIASVKEVSISYLNKLKTAETEIVNNVQKAYETQDTDLSGNLGSDASSLESNSIK